MIGIAVAKFERIPTVTVRLIDRDNFIHFRIAESMSIEHFVVDRSELHAE